MPPQERQQRIATLSAAELESLRYVWEFWARPNQLIPPGDWFVWFLRSGRGFGKTRTGAETVRAWAAQGYSPIALVGETKADVRDIMVEIGDSSLLKISPPGFMPKYEPSKRRVVWPNGVVGIVYSGDEPDQLRGPQHQKAWVDELAKFRYPQEAWDNLEMGLRIGDNPQVVVTTTPRPIRIVLDLLSDSRTVDVQGKTSDNAPNLNPIFLDRIMRKYGGTRLGRQELSGEILEDHPGALWKRAWIEETRLIVAPELLRVVVAVDPSTTRGGDEWGIIAAGMALLGGIEHLFVLEDASLQGTPEQAARAVATLYHKVGADTIVAEVNQGGEMVRTTLHTVDKTLPVKMVYASRGKRTRAEPISAIYEQKRAHHVGAFALLEDELCQWDAKTEDSPNRLDALVWGATELMLEENAPAPASARNEGIDLSYYKRERETIWQRKGSR